MGRVKDRLFRRRRGGILLHVTSLPGSNLGIDAYRFVDFLAEAGITVWQILPLGPTHEDLSPYQCLSVHAGNPKLISLQFLVEEPWFGVYDIDLSDCGDALWQGYRRFTLYASQAIRAEFAAFCREQAFWLEDYVLFQALRETQDNAPWFEWPQKLRGHVFKELGAVGQELETLMDRNRFEQFIFFRQWSRLKNYANGHGVLIFGDMPIFVAHDSADVWARPEYFTVDRGGRLTAMAGVPPDYFSATGQCWGNPLYQWDRLEDDGFSWWLERVRTQLKLCDIIRIDHFRGLESYWEIPAGSKTAVKGRWVKAPGEALFRALEDSYGSLPLVAEDLGVITPAVDALRDQFHLPGMKVLQFAFEGGPDNPYLPENHLENCVVYTGTHDNDTILGWFNSLSEDKRHHVYECLGFPAEPMPWALIECAFQSVAKHAVVPMQDLLELGSEGRMNLPGMIENNNWRWHFNWPQVKPDLAARIRYLVSHYGRL
ncbi:4-alpha-glucanotransferase [Nitrosococcus oceani]|uniref:4-alpha-glucanotransferase n=1 Tax=Nitrosococcus oceani TaxID=1229 RepID=UPI0004E87A7B|nr:4-alpha-glucanotransferase [Nitrosococcus oceani]KFI23493.1 4-alpha-glucanotransferase [Nitrosococcus oceani]